MTGPERAQVLHMIEAGQIDATDGVRLLSAVSQSADVAALANRWFRIRITDLATQRAKASVNLPLTWVRLGMRIGAHFSPELAQIDMDEMWQTIRDDAEGRILEVENLEHQERIEVFVD